MLHFQLKQLRFFLQNSPVIFLQILLFYILLLDIIVITNYYVQKPVILQVFTVLSIEFSVFSIIYST